MEIYIIAIIVVVCLCSAICAVLLYFRRKKHNINLLKQEQTETTEKPADLPIEKAEREKEALEKRLKKLSTLMILIQARCNKRVM